MWTPARISTPAGLTASQIESGGSQGCLGAVERGEEAVAGRVDLPAAVLRELASDDPIVLGEPLLPRGVTELPGEPGRIDDVRHQHRQDRASVRGGLGELSRVAEHVEGDEGLVADDPRIVAGRDVDDIVRAGLDLLAAVHPDAQAAAQDQLEMVDLARRRADDAFTSSDQRQPGSRTASPDHQPAAEVDVAAGCRGRVAERHRDGRGSSR